MSDKVFNLKSLIIANEYSYAGALGDPREHNLDPELIDISVNDVLRTIKVEHIVEALRQALRVAVPAVVIAHLDDEDNTCYGCADEGRDGCAHECKPNADGLCYEYCPPCQADMHREMAEVKARWLDTPVSHEIMSVVANIGLVEAQRTLDALRTRPVEEMFRIAGFEDAIWRLTKLRGPMPESRRHPEAIDRG